MTTDSTIIAYVRGGTFAADDPSGTYEIGRLRGSGPCKEVPHSARLTRPSALQSRDGVCSPGGMLPRRR